MNFKQKLVWFFRKFFKDYRLSPKTKKKSVKKLNKLIRKFKRKNRRKPNRKELRFLIVQASHMACRRRGKRGHWIRQRIREYLNNMHGRNFVKM